MGVCVACRLIHDPTGWVGCAQQRLTSRFEFTHRIDPSLFEPSDPGNGGMREWGMWAMESSRAWTTTTSGTKRKQTKARGNRINKHGLNKGNVKQVPVRSILPL
jgi:hypothetical protein